MCVHMKKKYTLQQLAEFLDAKLVGDAACVIESIAPLDKAGVGQISFLENARYRVYLTTTKASAVILTEGDAGAAISPLANVLLVKQPYLSYAKLSGLFDDTPVQAEGIHTTVIMGNDCIIDPTVRIGPNCVIGNNVNLGKNICIGAGCVIADAVVIGEDSQLFANVTLYHRVKIGARVLLHSGVVIGSDGFGNANAGGVWKKIYQLGSVVIGNDVEIGANTTVDRGAIEDTIIEDGVRLDNLIQVGHNVHIGAHTAIAGCVGIAGSAKIGKYCMIGGGVGINGHIDIADRVIVTGRTSVGKSITEPGIYSSGTFAMPHRAWWRILKRLTQIEDIVNRVNKLEHKSDDNA